MFKNYITITLRNFYKNKTYTLLNIAGLSVGLCCVILISLFITDELSYDRFHKNHERIHVVGRTYEAGSGERKTLSNPYPMGPTMVEEIPEVETYVAITYPYRGKISRDGNRFTYEERLIAATSEFFEMFHFPLIYGDPTTALAGPGTAVISRELANKYYPGENPMGKRLIIDRLDRAEYVITGVAEDPPSNSYLTFDVVFSVEGLSSTSYNRDSWRTSMYQMYVKLRPGADAQALSPLLEEMLRTHREGASTDRFQLMPIADLYLSDMVASRGFTGSYGYMYLFSAVVLFILVLACVNYMNLATARAVRRSLEVGVRKVMGAGRGDLMRQFLGESVLLAVGSFGLALFLAELALPWFNAFFEKDLAISFVLQPGLFGGLLLLVLFVGILSGSYPAFYLSRLKPSGILKNQNVTPGGVSLRKGLVVFQFAVTSAIIICTLVVLNQLQFIQQKDLGFEKDEVLYVLLENESVVRQTDSFRQRLESHSAVQNISHATGIPGRFGFSRVVAYNPLNPEHEFRAYEITADRRFDEVLGLQLLEGRFLDETQASSVDHPIVVNEAMVREMGWVAPQEALGKSLTDDRTVVGVISDFNFQSLKENVSPVIIESERGADSPFAGNDMLVIRFNPERLGELVTYMETAWHELTPEPLPLHFLNDELASQYTTERKLGGAFSLFAAISIVIACMGLFGLAAFTAERRNKEIGVRKVLGATVSQIVALLSRDFLKQVALGFLIAVPVSWYLMNGWLTDFAYRIEIGAGLLLVSGGLALAVAVLTVIWQAVRAATVNPVESLRSE